MRLARPFEGQYTTLIFVVEAYRQQQTKRLIQVELRKSNILKDIPHIYACGLQQQNCMKV